MMETVFLDVFDQFRFMMGTIFAEYIFMIHAVPVRERFLLRSIGGGILCLLLSLTYLPLLYCLKGIAFLALAGSAWWLAASLLTIGYMVFCFRASVGQIMFRCILGLSLQQVITVVLRYCIVGMWFPRFPEQYPVLYIVLTVALYGICGWAAYCLAGRRMHTEEELRSLDNRKMTIVYGGQILVFSLLFDITGGVFEWLLEPLEIYAELYVRKRLMEYFCIVVILLLCAVIFLLQFGVYEFAFLQKEKELMARLQAEKWKQYKSSCENIEIINQKCHDLKHQMQALKYAEDIEREGMIEDMKQAVQFYDAGVHTGNDVLDTILTEKSIVCTKKDIRLSCTIHERNLNRIAVIDLYTILGNALDNAIECVSRYKDRDKRVISLSIWEKSSTLCIIVDNYFHGVLRLKNGLPMTRKEDDRFHGYGLKSVKKLAEKYGGDIRISNEHHTFSLQILLSDYEQIKK